MKLGLVLLGQDVLLIKLKRYSLSTISLESSPKGVFLQNFLKGRNIPVLLNKREIIKLSTVRYLNISSPRLIRERQRYKLLIEITSREVKYKESNKTLRYKRKSLVNLNDQDL